MKVMKLAEVRKHTGRALSVEEPAQYVSRNQSIRSPATRPALFRYPFG